MKSLWTALLIVFLGGIVLNACGAVMNAQSNVPPGYVLSSDFYVVVALKSVISACIWGALFLFLRARADVAAQKRAEKHKAELETKVAEVMKAFVAEEKRKQKGSDDYEV